MSSLPQGTIAVDHLWKRFKADRGKAQIRDKFARAKARAAGQGGARGWRWALSDVDLVIEPGESVGLFGANGSGKSTLLKVLCRVMYPYAGAVEVSGRIGALIEVSSGMHPELTGRENTYLFGSLLGLPRSLVARKFDEIVAFAEVENAIDRQLKFYSSGMKMRLGFSVAAYLEPQVMLVDEVLAVGDASFQQKCLDRMRAVLTEGTTLVFVSHDLAAIEATCARGVWLSNGRVQVDGSVADALGAYRRAIEEGAEAKSAANTLLRLVKVEVAGPGQAPPRTQEPLGVNVVLECETDGQARLCLGVSEGTASPIFVVSRDLVLAPGPISVSARFAHLPLPKGEYFAWLGVIRKGKGQNPLNWQPVARFEVEGVALDPVPQAVVRSSPVHVATEWDVS
ncbi:MAG: ABC transporter ATP-binding protein [Acidimicrobiales bacterium]